MPGKHLEHAPYGQECTGANSGCKLVTSKEKAREERHNPLDPVLPPPHWVVARHL